MDVTKVKFSATDVPAGLHVSTSGVVSGTPTEPGTYRVGVEAETDWGTANSNMTIVVEGASGGNSQSGGSDPEPSNDDPNPDPEQP